MKIEHLMQGKSAKEKAKMKADALSKISIIPFMCNGGIEVTILSQKSEGERLIFELKAMKNGKELDLSNPFIFQNPPIMVPSGLKEKFLMEDGHEIEKNIFKEDHEEAIRQMIAECLRVVLK